MEEGVFEVFYLAMHICLNNIIVTANLFFVYAVYWLLFEVPDILVPSRIFTTMSQRATNLLKVFTPLFVALSIILFIWQCSKFDFLKSCFSLQWTLAMSAYLIFAKMSNYFDVKMFSCKSDRNLKSHMDQNLGCGMAINFWNGMLKHVTCREEDDVEPTLMDMIDEANVELSTKDYIILTPLSCDFEKKSEKWMACYNAEPPKVLGYVKVINFQTQQRRRPFEIKLLKVVNPDNPREYLAMCCDFAQVTKSCLGKEKYNTTDHRRSQNIQAFKKKLESLCSDNNVRGIKIIDYDDSKLKDTKNLFELIVDHVGKVLTEKEKE